MGAKKELEIVQHTKMNYLEVFLTEITARQPHGHDDLEIGVILAGNLYLYLESEVLLLHKGDIYIINRYQVHSFSCIKDKNLILAFQIDTDFYRRLNPSLSFIQFDNTVIHSGSLHDLVYPQLLSCALYYFEGNNNYELCCGSIFLNVLYRFLSSTHCHMVSEKEHSIAQNNSIRLNRITDYIAENYAQKLSLQDIAAMEHVTDCHASHFIKKMLGISFQEYLNNVRFEHAFRLINHSDFNVLDICLETGFSSSRYLNQMFQKRLGCSVKEYIKSEKKPCIFSPALPADNIQRRYNIEKTITILQGLST